MHCISRSKKGESMFNSRVFFTIFFMLLTFDLVASDVFITGGDGDALQAAINSANTPGLQVTIHLEAGQVFEENPLFGEFTGNLKIEGNGAIFRGGLALGAIAEDGAVTITGVTFIDAQTGPLTCPFIHNRGSFSLERVTFSGVRIETTQRFIQCASEELLLNEGSAELLNVTVVGTVISAHKGSLIWATGGGSTTIAHLTVLDPPFGPGSSQGVILRVASEGSISVSNSIILADGSIEGALIPCAGPITDNGGNFASAGDCGFSGVIDRTSLASTVEKGHDSWVLPLAVNSIAVDAGNPVFCEKRDGRGFTRDSQCDSGAYEVKASGRGGEIGRGGISGFYFTPETDGNYIQLQRAFDGNVVVVWNSFDKSGAQAWVYGVGSYQDRVVTADAFQNLGGILQAGAGASTATVTEWGTLKVTVHDCTHITVEYQSSDPSFGSGTFEAQRLAFVHDLGCSEE